MIKILIVEDEEPINNLIRMNLTKAGYQCKCAFDGQEAADMMAAEKFDLFLLDIMLPKINGYELLEYAQTLNTPVIFITAMGTVENKVKGLKKGADDYISKPFEIVELLARVETVLRRYNKAEKIIKILDIEVDTESRTVMQNGQQVILTLKEFELLLLFIRNKNIALYRDVIYESVWEGEDMGESRTVDLHVQRLKRKLHWENKIVAVYKVGYRLEA
ncbi:MAG: response regulator transcription factor [Lachnospiraceae bacterium]|jgi:two-component system alkaline phosphatase synthesis response regulator PhoP|nr:response regulator transcription factor [Clostridium sp.]MDY4821501.1 response regulator transcription factor [Lachnospiraceae bacterium]MEE0396923.1 response regulator transcription factor [Lachnospiraceae bacterium]CDA67988.1 dNA-binding response regulator VanRB [Clostridium sp. CAG:510]